MKTCSACGHALTPDGPCGSASITVGEKTTYLCHADDHSCYMDWPTATMVAASGYIALPDAADHPHTDPGDGRSQCDVCGKFVWPVTHSCKGVRVAPIDPDAKHFTIEPLPAAVRDLAAPSNGSVSSRPSPGADPRLAALRSVSNPVTREAILAAADAADRAAGIVRVRLVDLPDPEKLHLLADWLDMDDVIKNRLGNVEVQSDLRKWARAVVAPAGEQ